MICEIAESTSTDAGQVIEPTEKTAPPESVSKVTISAPPSSGLSPFARSTVFGGELGLILSVS